MPGWAVSVVANSSPLGEFLVLPVVGYQLQEVGVFTRYVRDYPEPGDFLSEDGPVELFEYVGAVLSAFAYFHRAQIAWFDLVVQLLLYCGIADEHQGPWFVVVPG